MPCENINEMMLAARRGGYAVGYFESWNLESLQGAVDAAEQSGSPIVLGFNGEFLSGPQRVATDRLEIYAAAGRAACTSARVPCGLIFNECPHDDWVRRASTLGFNLVMLADPHAPLEDYTKRVASIVRYAHEYGVSVEAEIGELPCGTSGTVGGGSGMTNPDVAEKFVMETGVDLLAVSVGNVHIMVKGSRPLDLARLDELRRHVPVPLVLHGGTGIEAESLRSAISMGVVKVNYGTYLKQRYLKVMRERFERSLDQSPHELLGIGGVDDLMVAGRLAVRDAVLERIPFLGCAGRG